MALFSWSNDQPLHTDFLFRQDVSESDLTCELATHEIPGLSLGVRVTQAGGRSCADRSPMQRGVKSRRARPRNTAGCVMKAVPAGVAPGRCIRCPVSTGSIGKGCEAKRSEPEVRTTGGVAKEVAGAG